MCDYILVLQGQDLSSAIQAVKPDHLVLGTEHKHNQSLGIKNAITNARSQATKTLASRTASEAQPLEKAVG